MEEYEAVRDACRSCKVVGAAIRKEGSEVKHGQNYLRDSVLRPWTPSMARIYDIEIASGRHITDADMRSTASVCTVGWDIVDNLFPNVDPIGKEIRVDGEVCQIIGVGKKLGTALGQSRDNWVIQPISRFQRTFARTARRHH